MTAVCALTGAPCALEAYKEGPCSENPTVDHAAACIRRLHAMVRELEVEVSDQDEIIAKQRSSLGMYRFNEFSNLPQ